jgi:HAD superfamily phosphoserine phosphatase-like hydrolase
MVYGQEKHGKQYLLMSDFDQTLSFNDSGLVLSEMLGITGFTERVAGLSNSHLVQQGGELAYLLLHDPEFRRVRKEHLIAVGKRIRLKENIHLLPEILEGLSGNQFTFYVISAAPQEVIQSALEGIVPPENIYGTQLAYDETGEIKAITCLRAGYGKVAVVEELRAKMPVSHDSLIYVGDGSSDIHVMLHVNRLDGLTIAVSENKYITQIARRTILSDNALSVLVPMLEEILGWDSMRIRALFHANGFVVQEWDKVRTDTLTISKTTAAASTSLSSAVVV